MLAAIEDFKTFLGVTDAAQDVRLSLILGQASAQIIEACGRNFSSSTFTEYYTGENQQALIVKQRPIISITSVSQDQVAYWGTASGAFPSDTLLVSGTGYALADADAGLIVNLGGGWLKPQIYQTGIIAGMNNGLFGNIKIVYVAGYASIPEDIQLAAMLLASHLRQIAPFGTILESEKYEDYSYTRPTLRGGAVIGIKSGMPNEVEAILKRYKNIAIG